MHPNRRSIAAYLGERLGAPVELVAISSLNEPDAAAEPASGTAPPLKAYGYGKPLLLRYRVAGAERRAVLRTVAPNAFGHERRADRAADLLLAYDSFNTLPSHVRACDIGVVAPDGGLRSLPPGEEFFLLTDYAPGQLYAHDMRRLVATGALTERDRGRAHKLACYLAEIHAVKRDEPALYRRHLRDLFGSGEGIVGLLDSYPADFALADGAWLESVERRCVEWRWRLKAHPERLAQIHGDFHPFNLLFAEDDGLTLLDRSRGPWGEPADDVSCMAINYLFFSLQRSGTLAPPFSELWDSFWGAYLAHSGDEGVLHVVQPFFAWRALVVASPVWYNVADGVRQALFNFIENILREGAFDPWLATAYLKG
jgi:aminoglycoside phosphotransferase (APT) family kinase protein